MKVILITGASSGIGYSTAELLAKNGYKVYAGARRVDKMEPLKELGVVPLSLDVTNEESAKNAIKTIIDSEGKIDVLFNNAGYGSYGPIEQVSLQEAQKQLDVNVLGVARMSQLVLPYMRKQNDGRIIVTSSVGGKVTSYLGGWYHVSKFAVEALSNSIRMDVADFGIKVSIIEPSGVMTEWGSIAADHLEDSGKNSPYEKITKKVADYYRQMYLKKSSLVNDPKKIALIVKKAIEAKKPKTRYQDSLPAKASILMSRLAPDKFLDKMMKNTVVK
ncbi:oxidoreductase [Xylocopilactobacillus apis]|uniref:Short-chain dehydrogenase/reductase n=1 Tax=Xylocopilactobacillus apis TaxID=2932183 RepID=A0AAU9DQ80_9LACO|nr:oxidoreductase [Xylocopilactobacillus apis]BDR55728.1 short-chain dehydrogenase/reductase [Xylocopilactobacillus apis]